MKKILTLLLCLVLMISISGCGKKVSWNGKTEEFVDLLMVEDISDRNRYVGLVDYVFVGTVEEIVNDVLPRKIKKHEDHYSVYRIHVDRNLKGELVDEIEASKMGGYKKDGTMCLAAAELPDGERIVDSGLPELNGQYVFMAYAQPDGSLVLSEIFDNRAYSDDVLEEYLNDIQKEIVFERERFLSKYAK